MNHDEATLYFDTVGGAVDSRPPMSDLLSAGRGAERRKRRRAVGAAALAVAVVVGGGAVAGQFAGGDDGKPAPSEVAAPPTEAPAEPQAGLTEAQTSAAVRLVEAYRRDNPSAEVRTAYARWAKGTVAQPNVGECTSGELLQVSLFGTFPGIATSGPPPGLSSPSTDPDPSAGEVTEVMLTADAKTAAVCLVGVGTGDRTPDPRGTLVFRVRADVAPSADATDVPDGATPVENLDNVRGAWSLIDGELGMTITRNGKRYFQAFPIDCNGGSQPLRLDSDGVVRLGSTMSTLIGCGTARDYPQPHPLVEGQRLFVTPQGHLLAVNPSGLVAAEYVQAAPD